MLKKYVTLYNRETGEERTMLDFHAAYVLRVCSDWTDTMEEEPKPKRKKRGD